MQITQKILAVVKARWPLFKSWAGRPGYLGFGLLGIGTFVSGARHDNGMGLLFVTAILAFVAERRRPS